MHMRPTNGAGGNGTHEPSAHAAPTSGTHASMRRIHVVSTGGSYVAAPHSPTLMVSATRTLCASFGAYSTHSLSAATVVCTTVPLHMKPVLNSSSNSHDAPT